MRWKGHTEDEQGPESISVPHGDHMAKGEASEEFVGAFKGGVVEQLKVTRTMTPVSADELMADGCACT